MNSIRVNLTPREAYNIIKSNMSEELVHSDVYEVGNKEVCVLIYEKYYMRAKNRASLTVIIDNVNAYTTVKSIPSGSSQGMLFNFDWGAGDDFAYRVKYILESYIL